ncbi:MAG: hypothetical protein FJZ10_05515 [Candidatus Omnitrophica bacterium]|nr:hypothetical protein [Candidatus Omnitrophota bacterium]
MKNKIAALLFIISFLILITKLSFALSCKPWPTEYHFLNSDVVFTGKVENIEELGKQNDMYVKNKVTLTVEQIFKGDLLNSITVFENTYWGAMFKENERYLVFANFLDEELIVEGCSGTKNMKYVSDELKKIENIKQLIQRKINSIRNADKSGNFKYEISVIKDGSIEYKEFDGNGRLAWLDSFKDSEHKSKQFLEDGRYSYLEFFYKNGKLTNTKGYDQNGKLILDENTVQTKLFQEDKRVDCDKLKKHISLLFDKLNYCDVDSDCIYSGIPDCSFGCCGILVNKDVDLAEAKEAVMEFRENCLEECDCLCPPTIMGRKCKDNKCVWAKQETISPEQALNLSLPIEVEDVIMYDDGGTIGVILKDSKGKTFTFCADNRMLRSGPRVEERHLYVGTLHPDNPGSREIPLSGKEERAILMILQDLMNRELSQEEQKKLLNTVVTANLSEKELQRHLLLTIIRRLKK